MKCFFGLAAAAVILAFPSGAAAGDKEEAAVRRQVARFDAEVAKGNLDALLTLFADDAMILGPSQPPISGKPAIRAWWKGILEQFAVEAVHDLTEVASVGDAIIVRGKGRGLLKPRAGGDPVPVDTWFLQVYRRRGDGSFAYWRGAFGPNTTTDRR
jgi:uncharacterized protein (TIGR02246 family)